MSVDAALIDRTRGGSGGEEVGFEFGQREDILKYNIDWAKLNLEPLAQLTPGATGTEIKDVLLSDPDMMAACLMAVMGQERNAFKKEREEIRAMEYMVTILYDAFREDASVSYAFEDLLRPVEHRSSTPEGGHCSSRPDDHQNWVLHLLNVIEGTNNDGCNKFCTNKAAYILTTIISQDSRFITHNVGEDGRVGDPIPLEDGVAYLLRPLLKASSDDGTMTKLGVLESLTNLLKNPDIRKMVWTNSGVAEMIFSVEPSHASPVLYKSVFAMWLCSFDEEVSLALGGLSLKSLGIVDRLKGVLMSSRVEKVVRLTLATLKNLLGYKDLCEDIVEKGTLEVVQQLEFEKWRDADMYDEIKDVVHTITCEVRELSSFERYERELAEGNLKWGFIHSDRFWQENVTKFEKDQFAAVTKLGAILKTGSASPTTLAVACHDIGEFAALHPLGKKKVADFALKDNIMDLMSRPDAEYREVRREALLCCQKIMLDRWQEVSGVAAGAR